MNRAENALKEQLEPMLREHGFKRQASGLAFKRRTAFGFHYLSIPSFAMGQGGPYVVNVGLGVRHNQIDNVVNRLGHIWGESNQKNTVTVYRGLEYFPFDSERDGRKVIGTDHVDSESNTVASNISAMLFADGFDFFRMYSDARECSRGLNEPIEATTHPLFNNFPKRAYYGVAAAALSEPERVQPLVQSYADYARTSNVVDNGVYDVGKELSGIDAIVARLEFVAEAGLASTQ